MDIEYLPTGFRVAELNKVDSPNAEPIPIDKKALARENELLYHELADEIVSTMNEEIYAASPNEALKWIENNGLSPMEYMSDGNAVVIRFLGIPIWSNETDEREMDEAGDPVITLHNHIRQLTDDAIRLISSLLIGPTVSPKKGLEQRIQELTDALKYHQDQTRPIERTINVLKKADQ